MKPKVLITGSNGQLGTGIKVAARSNNTFDFLYADIDELDVTDKKAVHDYIAVNKPSYIINCAGYTAVDRAEEEPETAMLANATSVKNIVEAISGSGCRLFHISTDYVLDGIESVPLTEDAKPHPVSVYSKSKYQGELNALEYQHSIVIRTSWLYSPYGNNFVKTIIRLAGERDEIRVVDDQEGSPTCASDLAEALLTIIERTENRQAEFIPGIYHYSNEGSCTWYEFAMAIKEYKNLDVSLSPIPTTEYPLPAYRPAYSVLRKEKIKKVYSLEIREWRDSLKECLLLM